MKLPAGWSGCERVLTDFNDKGIEYLIFGSMARSYYRPLRHVGDMDLLINATKENAGRLKPALEAAMNWTCDQILDRTVEDLARPGQQITWSDAERTPHKAFLNVDFFTAKPEFDFPRAFSRSIAVEVVDGIIARIACEADLEILDSFEEPA